MLQLAMKILDGRTEPHRISLAIAGGSLVAYTGRAPDKDSDNEDTVAAIPYGPEAVVLVIADGAGGMPGGRRASGTAVTVLGASLQRAMNETILLRT